MPFPLLDLPDEALDQVLGLVSERKDKRLLRLACKRTCATVDRAFVWAKPPINQNPPLPHLVGAPWKLQRLTVRNYDVGPSGVALLATANWPGLVTLCLSGCGLGDADVTALTAANWPGLRRLNLAGNGLGTAGVAALSAAWPDLTVLELSRNLVTAEGAAVIAAHWPALETMNLAHNSLQSAGALALLAGRWEQLRELNVSGNALGQECVVSMEAQAPQKWPRLCHLNLLTAEEQAAFINDEEGDADLMEYLMMLANLQ